MQWKGPTRAGPWYRTAAGLMSTFLRLNGKALGKRRRHRIKTNRRIYKTVQIRSAAYWSSGNNVEPASINKGGNYVSDLVISIFKTAKRDHIDWCCVHLIRAQRNLNRLATCLIARSVSYTCIYKEVWRVESCANQWPLIFSWLNIVQLFILHTNISLTL